MQQPSNKLMTQAYDRVVTAHPWQLYKCEKLPIRIRVQDAVVRPDKIPPCTAAPYATA